MLVVIIIVWAAKEFAHVVIPNEVAMAIGGLIQLVVTHVVPNSPRNEWTPEQRMKVRGLEAEIEKAKEQP